MANSYDREFPKDSKRITTGCQYCAVGCGYNAFLSPKNSTTDKTVVYTGVSRYITPSMTGTVNFQGQAYDCAVAPDVQCDLNKGNYSIRGGSQGQNLVSADLTGRSTEDRLKSPMVRLADGRLHEITWEVLNKVMARLLIERPPAILP